MPTVKKQIRHTNQPTTDTGPCKNQKVSRGPVDFQEDKKRAQIVLEKIMETLKDPKKLSKAATILSYWISGKK